MRSALGLCLFAAGIGLAGAAHAQSAEPPPTLNAPLRISPEAPPAAGPEIRIAWEVPNRFRLFRSEADFNRLARTIRGRSVPEAEQLLATETD